MAMPYADFVTQLRALGYDVQKLGNNKIVFPYAVRSGRLAGQTFRIGLLIPPDYPLSPPSGPHVSPKVHPNCGNGAHPTGGIHDSTGHGNFGPDFQYWSRPFREWPSTSRDAKAYIGHILHLFDTQ